MLFSLAFRNIIKSKGRSITTLLLSTFSTILFISYVALMDGSHNQIIKSSVEIYTGYAHVNLDGYRDEGGYDHLIEDADHIDTILKNDPSIRLYSPRFETYALLSGEVKTIGSLVGGIIPSREKTLSKLHDSLIKGAYLEDHDTNAIYIGSELSERLNVDVGSEIAMVGSSVDYSIAADLFTVKGIFKTGLFEFDSQSAFVNKFYLDSVMMSENIASYFTLDFYDNDKIDKITIHLQNVLPAGYEAVNWKTLLTALVQAMLVDSIFGYISISIFFLVIFFVIMIFSYVSIYTRAREIGLLRALGLTSKDIFGMLFIEILMLATISIILGTIVGAFISYYFELNPIVISGIAETYKEYGVVSDEIPMNFDLFTITWNALTIFILNLAAIIYPIFKVNKLTAMEAMRYV
ncbi:FtsX-like permease family protein [Sulfurovum sp. XGS-02]|uniref:ABC transporter permease n=1 Tax=Sulfurovum sp. XGS-02 TaxID=2925411 RepID=UPI0020637493|nr:FtsX-like permease family protein [Sulfurovum sp. XGS-02]UPT78426.1 FtsX-like permease family protein [Sulfurovum sp. XGS-02]